MFSTLIFHGFMFPLSFPFYPPTLQYLVPNSFYEWTWEMNGCCVLVMTKHWTSSLGCQTTYCGSRPEQASACLLICMLWLILLMKCYGDWEPNPCIYLYLFCLIAGNWGPQHKHSMSSWAAFIWMMVEGN